MTYFSSESAQQAFSRPKFSKKLILVIHEWKQYAGYYEKLFWIEKINNLSFIFMVLVCFENITAALMNANLVLLVKKGFGLLHVLQYLQAPIHLFQRSYFVWYKTNLSSTYIYFEWSSKVFHQRNIVN